MDTTETPPLNEEEFIAASVNYWANFFKRPAHGRVASNELSEMESHRAVLASNAITSGFEITDFKIQRFKDHLRVQMEDALKSSLRLNGRSWNIVVDWEPEYEIATACLYAELPGSVFPKRMMMFFNPKEATIIVGPIGNTERTQIYPAVA